MNRRRPLHELVVLLGVVAAWSAFAQTSSTARRTTAPAQAPAAATVAGRRIPLAQVDDRARRVIADLQARYGGAAVAESRDIVRRQALESLIRVDLLVLEAKKQGIDVSAADAEARLRQDDIFKVNGRFDEARYLAIKASQPAEFADALAKTREQLAAQRLNDRLQRDFAPSADDVRARTMRGLSAADLEGLMVPSAGFLTIGREPSEAEVLADYRRRASEYRESERAVLSIAFVNEPALSAEDRAQPGALETWKRRMGARADSLLARIRSGASFDETVAPLGGARSGVVILDDNLPGYWAAPPSVTASVFRTPIGQVVPVPIPAREGFLLVRVDQSQPARQTPLVEVASQVRARLRREAGARADEVEARAAYAQFGDSLRRTAYRIRLAVSDTADVKVGEPDAAELDRFYRGRVADYSRFDTKSGAIVVRPLSQVRSELIARWKRERRTTTARAQAEALFRAWSAGQRASALEAVLRARDLPAAPAGSVLDTGLAASVLSDTIWAKGAPQGAGFLPYPRGYLVWRVTGTIPALRPTFEQARALLQNIVAEQRVEAETTAARRLYESEPGLFVSGNRIHFTRLVFDVRQPPDVPLSRDELLRYYQEHITSYSAPEEVQARHILLTPSDSSESANRDAFRRAMDLVRRARAGEDFAELARQNSDDPATRDAGGDLGAFTRGTMLSDFEDAAFAMKAGEISNPVRTELGWHVIWCTNHWPRVAKPLAWLYANVGQDAASAKAESLAMKSADSLLRVCRTAAQARAAAPVAGAYVDADTWVVGDRAVLPEWVDMLKAAKPGQLLPRVFRVEGQGAWLTTVDSISEPRPRTWTEARHDAIQLVRARAERAGLEQKCRELDSLATAGWSLDSLAGLWGGLERFDGHTPGQAFGDHGTSRAADSLVFGTPGSPALAVGVPGPWADMAAARARFVVRARHEPAAEEVARREQLVRRQLVERSLSAYFAELAKRYPVRILDEKLRAVELPVPPAFDP